MGQITSVNVAVTNIMLEVSMVGNTILDECGEITRGQYTKHRVFGYV